MGFGGNTLLDSKGHPIITMIKQSLSFWFPNWSTRTFPLGGDDGKMGENAPSGRKSYDAVSKYMHLFAWMNTAVLPASITSLPETVKNVTSATTQADQKFISSAAVLAAHLSDLSVYGLHRSCRKANSELSCSRRLPLSFPFSAG